MSQISFNNERYNERNAAFNLIRSQAPALNRAKAARDRVKYWNPATREGTGDHAEKIVTLGRKVGATAAYFDNKRSSALEIICNYRFTLHYQLYGDVGRQAVEGENTLSIFTEVTWDRCAVSASLYADKLEPVQPRAELVAAAREGVPNLDTLRKVTGWSRNDMNAFPMDQMSMFKTLLNEVSTGQHKLTRLVKGFLMMLECMERGSIDVVLNIQHVVDYTPLAVTAAFRAGERAYVHNSMPENRPHAAVLWRMCGAYPPPELAGSHVSIPADAANTYMVHAGQLATRGLVNLTPGVIYSSLTAYAMDTSCTGSLQSALIIACSLQQNRYFSNVKLPQVVSKVDLMLPSMMKLNTRLDKPMISQPMGMSIGRLHQMLMFMSVKDMLTAAELSTSDGFDPTESMRSYLSSQATLLKQMAGDISSLTLLEATLKMRIHESLSADDYDDILGISAFEGLWLCDENRRSVENGILAALTNGVSDLSGRITSFDVVQREMNLGKIVYKPHDIPQGAFTIRWVCASKTEPRFIPRDRRRITKHVSLVQKCDATPGSLLRERKPKIRFGENKEARPPTPTTAIPITSVMDRTKRSPPPRTYKMPKRVSYAVEPRPPVITTRSESPVIEEEIFEQTSPPPSYSSPEERRSNSSRADEDATSETASEPPPARVLTATKIASEAAARVTGALQEAMAANEVEKVAKDTANQVTASDSIKRLKKEGDLNLSGKEVSSLANILDHTGYSTIAARAKQMDDVLDKMEEGGAFINYDREGMLGQSNIAKRINAMIDRGSNRNTFGSELRRMREQKKDWEGDVEKAPKEGIRYIQNSASWMNYLEERAIPLDDRDPSSDIPSRFVLAEIVSRVDESFTVKDVRLLWDWLAGASSSRFPMAIKRDELLGAGDPVTLPYRHAPASFGQREIPEDDGQWIMLAVRVQRPIYTPGDLIPLTSAFTLSREQIAVLRERYGLFEGRPTSVASPYAQKTKPKFGK